MTTTCIPCGFASVLGGQIDIDLTLAVAAAMTPQELLEWRNGDNTVRSAVRHGFGHDSDAEWLTDLIDQYYPNLDEES